MPPQSQVGSVVAARVRQLQAVGGVGGGRSGWEEKIPSQAPCLLLSLPSAHTCGSLTLLPPAPLLRDVFAAACETSFGVIWLPDTWLDVLQCILTPSLPPVAT